MDSLEIVMLLGTGAAIWAMIIEIRNYKKIYKEKLKGDIIMEEKTCEHCKWWMRTGPVGWCLLNPRKVEKMFDDFCSHWTAKQLNEVIK